MAEGNIFPTPEIVIKEFTGTTNNNGVFFVDNSKHLLILGAMTDISCCIFSYWSSTYGSAIVLYQADMSAPIANTTVTVKAILMGAN